MKIQSILQFKSMLPILFLVLLLTGGSGCNYVSPLKTENTNLAKTVEQLAYDNRVLSIENERLKTQLDASTKTIEKLEAEIEDLSSKLEE